jgi:hypothetical protein
MSDETGKVQGVNQKPTLTGQVCAQHRLVPHSATGDYWCNYCGKDDTGKVLGTSNGGWMP